MNCENYQDLLSYFVDGSLISKNENDLKAHLTNCAACAAVSTDLQAIVSFCLEHRGCPLAQLDQVRVEG